MSNFKTWLEFTGGMEQSPSAQRPGYESNKQAKIDQLWKQIFKDVGFGGDPPSKTASKSLEELTETEPNDNPGRVVSGRLANVLRQLAEADPELDVQGAVKWLEDDKNNEDGIAAPKKQFSDFLKILFGEDKFMELLNTDPQSSDSQPAPKPTTYPPDQGSQAPTAPPEPEVENPEGPEAPPEQPQVPANQQLQSPPPTQNPPPPAGVGGPNHMSFW